MGLTSIVPTPSRTFARSGSSSDAISTSSDTAFSLDTLRAVARLRQAVHIIKQRPRIRFIAHESFYPLPLLFTHRSFRAIILEDLSNTLQKPLRSLQILHITSTVQTYQSIPRSTSVNPSSRSPAGQSQRLACQSDLTLCAVLGKVWP